ncbi:MAG: ABC transporter permease [Actinobacteria bacterium]|nr:ABC transporter permease [Actinomycetota bacterium]
MSEFILRRLVMMIPVVLIVSVIAFSLLYVLPGDPAVAILGENAGNRDTYVALRTELGLDQPLYVQYWRWLERVLGGDLGKSIRTGEPVAVVLARRIPVSLVVGLSGMAVGLLLGIPAAIVSAMRPGSRLDSFATVVGLGGIAIPAFFEALLLMYLFAVTLRWLPPSGYTPFMADPVLAVRMLVMPALVLGTHASAVIMRQGRAATRHALKNAMIPIITIIGLQVGNLVSGAVLVETVFAIPGVGRASVDAIFFRDYPMLQGSVLLLTTAVLFANLLTDLAYAYVDPRIRYR